MWQLWPIHTSSAANVGTDKDSEKRQRHAIQGFANAPGSRSSMSFMMRRSRVPIPRAVELSQDRQKAVRGRV